MTYTLYLCHLELPLVGKYQDYTSQPTNLGRVFFCVEILEYALNTSIGPLYRIST
jgi:hypothetical protein